MNNLMTYGDVDEFMDAFDQNETGFETKQFELYCKLIDEEYVKELLPALKSGDIVEIADGIMDLIWVLQGLAITLKIPMQECWNEVSRSNFSKIPKDGILLKREDGKVMKPDTYSPPDIKTILIKANIDV